MVCGSGSDWEIAALEDDLGRGRARKRAGVAPARGGVVDDDLVEGGDVDAGDCREGAEKLFSAEAGGTTVAHAGAHVDDALLPVAEQDGVEELGNRLAVPDRGAARDHDGVVLVAVGREQGDAGEVERLEDVGAGHLVGEREADDVEGRDGRGALEREQGHVALAHEVGHVDPGQVAALAAHARLRVERAVEDGEAHVGQADLVDVGVHEADVEGSGLVGLGAPLVVEVARGLLHERQQGLDEVVAVLSGKSHCCWPIVR